MTIRTLVFCPSYRMEPETVNALLQLDLSPGPADIFLTRDNPYRGSAKANVLYNYRKGRRVCLDGGYDAMLIIESDIIPPSDTLPLLSSVADADVALGYYLLRKASGATPNLTTGYNAIYHHWDEDQVIPAQGEGLGCVLVWRHVLASIDFRHHEGNSFCDMSFYEDVRRQQFITRAHMGVRCGHKRPDGKILWPDREYGMRITQGIPSPWHMREAQEQPDYE